jgi:hypothetical protein
MDNLNNDIMQALAQAYMNMLAESHTHEQLMKLSVEKLKELKAEYVKKIGEAEGEEKEKHQKELANIEDILASRKDDKEEVKEGKDTSDKKVKKVTPKNPHRDVPRGVLPDWMERRMDKWNTEEDAEPIKEEIQQVDEIFDSPAGQKAARSYILKARADKEKVGDEADAIDDEIHAKVEAEAGHPDSGMGREAVRANLQFMPGGEKLLKDKERLDKKYKSRDTGIKRALSKLKPMEESENKDCGCNHVQESMEKINALKERAAKMREIGKNK